MLSVILQLKLNEINVPAQIVMLCAFLIMTCSFWCKDRKKILGLQVVSSMLFVLQYVLLGAKTGAILNFICIGRAYIFKFKDKYKNINSEVETKIDKVINNVRSNAILYVFILVYIIASLITWEGPKGILALMATLVYTVGMWEDKPQNIRIGANIASFFWVSYNIIVGGYVGCITETFMFVSNTIAIIKNSKNTQIE